MTMTAETTTWVPVCEAGALAPASGAAALLPGGSQVAVFRDLAGTCYALSNLDPFSGAHVLARGIVGDRGGIPVVSSPMHKQCFELHTGVCLDDESVSVAVYPVRIVHGMLQVRAP